MKISDLFDLYQGNGFELINMTSSRNSNINFVSRTAQNNGVVTQVNRYGDVSPFESGLITVALGGSVLSSFVQLKPFYTAFHIMVLRPKREMTINEKLYYCLCIKSNAYRYSYGRQANKSLKNIEFPDNIPEWVYRASFKPVKTNVKKKELLIDLDKWKEFLLSDLFNISVSKDSNFKNSSIGIIPYVSSSAENNGITAYINAKVSQQANTLTIARNGSVGATFYQATPYCSSPDDIRILSPKFNMNVYSGLFIKTIIEKEKFRYAYGRKLGTKRIMKTYIKLPAKSSGELDLEYMENYIKSLPYSDRI